MCSVYESYLLKMNRVDIAENTKNVQSSAKVFFVTLFILLEKKAVANILSRYEESL